jgi:integrase
VKERREEIIMKAEEIKNKTSEAVAYLVDALQSGQSEVLSEYLTTMARFHNYSFGNIVSKYTSPEDYVFATDAGRAGSKRGKQPLWLAKVMQYHIQPAAQRVGIQKQIAWHTFRHTYTTLLHSNREDIKVVQELLRHGSAKITMDV